MSIENGNATTNATEINSAQPEVAPIAPTTGRILKPVTPKTSQPKVAKAIVALGADEKASRTMTMISPRKMRVTYTFKLSASATTRYQMSSVFDFSKCSDEEFLQLAVATAVITIQGKIRAGGESGLKAGAYDVVDVKRDVVDTQRVALDPDVAAIRALMRATGVSEQAARATVVGMKAKSKSALVVKAQQR